MTGASKILTVSYGTFSCTLEGFDDPFNTMKAIAEYFRDLAAEDRYFGAEPPTPDAAMLHRIAEREIQRRVEAKIQDNGVVLRASEAVPAAAQAGTAPQPVQTAPAVAPLPDVAPLPAVAPSVAPAAATTGDALTESAGESIVQKLSRLRSEVAAQPGAVVPAATVPFVSFAIPDYIEDQGVEDVLPVADLAVSGPVTADLAVPDPAADGDAADVLPEQGIADTFAAEDPPLPEDTAPPEPELPDSLLAALAAPETEATAPQPDVAPVPADVAEPVSAAGADLPEEADDAAPAAAGHEDDPVAAVLGAMTDAPDLADELAPDDGDDLILPEEEALLLPEKAAEIVADTASQEDAYEAADSALDDALAATLQGLVARSGPVDTAEAAPVDDDAEPEVPDPAETALYDDVLSRIDLPHDLQADVAAAGDEAGEAADEPEPAAPASSAPASAGRNEAIAAIFAPEDGEPTTKAQAVSAGMNGLDLRPGAAEKLQRARARVIRIRRSDDAAADAVPSPAETAEAAAESAAESAAAAAASEAAADLREEEDADLSSVFADPAKQAAGSAARTAADEVRALLSAEDEAELQRELAALRAADEEAELAAQQEARKALESASADEAMGRLMQQTDTEMEGTETKRRQSAIAHLKAAVAATVAERKVTGDKPADETTVSRLARYRNDLAMVVKSALPKVAGDKSPAERPAPLVLVSEQRIDRPRSAASPSPAPSPAITAVPQPAQTGIRPRRVSSAGLAMQASPEEFFEEEGEEDIANLFGETKGFAEFVERVGAVTLEQMLEASAAYLAGVEGREYFSRPQLMWHVSAVVPQGSYQREDGLRSFGTLLRDGRIAKVRRGQFALSEESPYLAEAKKIAG